MNAQLVKTLDRVITVLGTEYGPDTSKLISKVASAPPYSGEINMAFGYWYNDNYGFKTKFTMAIDKTHPSSECITTVHPNYETNTCSITLKGCVFESSNLISLFAPRPIDLLVVCSISWLFLKDNHLYIIFRHNGTGGIFVFKSKDEVSGPEYTPFELFSPWNQAIIKGHLGL